MTGRSRGRWPSLRAVLRALGVAALLALAVLAWAQPEAAPRRTVLRLEGVETRAIGRPVIVGATLVNLEGEPQGNKVLEAYLDGARLRRYRTDDAGRIAIRLSGDLSEGTHELRVRFDGTDAYAASTASTTVTLRLPILTIRTVPPVAGVTIRIGAVHAVTDAQGAIRTDVARAGEVDLAIVTPDDAEVGPATRVAFERWGDSRFTPERTIEVRRDTELEVGFGLRHPLLLAFRDARDGEAVGWDRVDEVVLRGANGSYHTLVDDAATWIAGGRVQRARTGLYYSPLLYSVESVIVDGTNVVNRYQQRFLLGPHATWTIDLLLYSARFRARDAVFGFPLGTGIDLEYPDGTIASHSFDANGEVHLERLARGLYRAQVRGVRGVAPPTPVALSRDQDVTLKVLSAFDVASGAIVGLTLAIGLLALGRPTLFGIARRDRPAISRVAGGGTRA